MDNWTDLQNNNITEFLKNYRASLEALRDSNRKNLEQQRRAARTSIMGVANKGGYLYSNFPERSKLSYDVGTFIPAIVKNQQSYQTGLDSLRNKTVDLWNTIQSYQEAIGDLNLG